MAGKRTKRKGGKRPARGSGRRACERGAPVELTAQAVIEGNLDIDLPMPAFPGLVTSKRQERRIRRAFMEWDNGWRKRTPISRRLPLGELPVVDHVMWNGVSLPMRELYGYASKVRVTPEDGKRPASAKLMLSRPMHVDGNGKLVPVDDHIWLDVDQCMLTTRDVMRVRYGDMVRIGFNLQSYEHHGMKRLGIGKWLLGRSDTLYADAKAGKSRCLPDLFGDESLMLVFNGYRPPREGSSYTIMDDDDLAAYLSDLASDESLRSDLPTLVEPDDCNIGVKLL